MTPSWGSGPVPSSQGNGSKGLMGVRPIPWDDPDPSQGRGSVERWSVEAFWGEWGASGRISNAQCGRFESGRRLSRWGCECFVDQSGRALPRLNTPPSQERDSRAAAGATLLRSASPQSKLPDRKSGIRPLLPRLQAGWPGRDRQRQSRAVQGPTTPSKTGKSPGPKLPASWRPCCSNGSSGTDRRAGTD